MLQDIEDSYTEEDRKVMGDPEIMVDIFKKSPQGHFQYAGFDKNIKIELTNDGIYHVIDGFCRSP
jgi:hypothetical protein